MVANWKSQDAAVIVSLPEGDAAVLDSAWPLVTSEMITSRPTRVFVQEQ